MDVDGLNTNWRFRNSFELFQAQCGPSEPETSVALAAAPQPFLSSSYVPR